MLVEREALLHSVLPHLPVEGADIPAISQKHLLISQAAAGCLRTYPEPVKYVTAHALMQTSSKQSVAVSHYLLKTRKPAPAPERKKAQTKKRATQTPL